MGWLGRRRNDRLPLNERGTINLPTNVDGVDLKNMAPGGLPSPFESPQVCLGYPGCDCQGPPNYRVTTLAIAPGDVIVIESPTRMSREAFDSLSEKVKASWPENKLMVLECGMHIHIAEEVEESTNNDTEASANDSSIGPGLDPGNA